MLVWLASAACGWLLWAAERTVPGPAIASLPEPVRRQFTRLFPDSDLIRVEIRNMEGRDAYELKGLSRDGKRNFWLYVTPNAEIVRIAEQLAPEELSPAVHKSAMKAFPSAVIQKAEKKSEIKVSYVLRLNDKGVSLDVLLSPEGNILEIRKEHTPADAHTTN